MTVTAAPRADWIDFRASVARIARRQEVGETGIVVCPDCGTETDVVVVVHSPRCPVVNIDSARAERDRQARALVAFDDGEPQEPFAPGSDAEVEGEQVFPAEELVDGVLPVDPGQEVVATGVDGGVGGKRPGAAKKWTRDAIVASLQAFAAEQGRRPVAHERGVVPVAACVREFGSWSGALTAAGLDSLKKTSGSAGAVGYPAVTGSAERTGESVAPSLLGADAVPVRPDDPEEPPELERESAATPPRCRERRFRGRADRGCPRVRGHARAGARGLTFLATEMRRA